jgi:transcriptional regulator with XRE-family HTH domain
VLILSMSWCLRTLRDFAAQTGIDIGQASRIENGRRPPTEKVVTACDAVFPERKGWFLEYYSELRGWSEVPSLDRIPGHPALVATDDKPAPRGACACPGPEVAGCFA